MGQLGDLAIALDEGIGTDTQNGVYVVGIIIGLLSSIVDNVPLVAAAMGMYETTEAGLFMQDGTFWQFLAYCAGTGGSALIIGSAAGVAVMGLEKISFGWYLKNISLLALVGYLAGAGVYILQNMLLA
jgi:Na+/H+ antiporter NhaD/arsenite permease-like protein